MAGCLGIEATQPDRVHLELGGQQITDLPGLLIATLGEVLHPFSPLRGVPGHARPVRHKVTVSAKSPANLLPALAKIKEASKHAQLGQHAGSLVDVIASWACCSIWSRPNERGVTVAPRVCPTSSWAT